MSVNLGKVVQSLDYTATNASPARLRIQTVVEEDGLVGSTFHSSWLRVTHLALWNDSLSMIKLQLDFTQATLGATTARIANAAAAGTTTGATWHVWQALGNDPSAGPPVPIVGLSTTLTIPNLQRGFTAEIRLPLIPSSADVPIVTILSADGFPAPWTSTPGPQFY